MTDLLSDFRTTFLRFVWFDPRSLWLWYSTCLDPTFWDFQPSFCRRRMFWTLQTLSLHCCFECCWSWCCWSGQQAFEPYSLRFLNLGRTSGWVRSETRGRCHWGNLFPLRVFWCLLVFWRRSTTFPRTVFAFLCQSEPGHTCACFTCGASAWRNWTYRA